MILDPATDELLRECLADAQRIGAIGIGGLDDQIVQATGFFAGLAEPVQQHVVDLGSGGGLPALPLALLHPTTTWVLVDAWERRVALLRRFVRRLGLGDRVEVVAARAEDFARTEHRAQADLVTARSFGPAAVTLECAAPLLAPAGRVLLSVRQDDAAWPEPALAQLGLATGRTWQVGRFSYREARAVAPCPDRWPRRTGVPERSPLF